MTERSEGVLSLFSELNVDVRASFLRFDPSVLGERIDNTIVKAVGISLRSVLILLIDKG